MRVFFYVLWFLIMAVNLLMAVEPDEILANKELEKRAREISSELRCLVCQNENIDESNAELARDLRLLVRERLVLGHTDEEIYSFLHSRYGDFVLLRPKFSGSGLVLWILTAILFFFSLVSVIVYIKKNNTISDKSTEDDILK